MVGAPTGLTIADGRLYFWLRPAVSGVSAGK